MNRIRSYGFIIVTLLAIGKALQEKKPIRIYMAGDSTMCLYEPSRAPLTGWGMPFAHFFDSSVAVINKARGGRSTRTFISEKRWQEIMDSIRQDDYVFIQFGHNDEAKEEKYKDRYTPVPDYRKNLLLFIDETKSRKAHPILVTPVSRMKFDRQDNALETHQEYTAAMLEVAKSTGTPVIDLDGASRRLYQELGPAATRLLFMQLDSLQHPNYPSGQKDNTHFSEYGARRIAELVLAECYKVVPELAARVVKRLKK